MADSVNASKSEIIVKSNEAIDNSTIIDSLKTVVEQLKEDKQANETVNTIIKFMDVWPFWIIVIVVIILVYYRKGIKVFLNSFDKIKAGSVELSGKKDSPNENLGASVEASLPLSETDGNNLSISNEENIEQQNSEEKFKLSDSYLKLEKGKLNEATEIFDKVQETAKSDSDRQKNIAEFTYHKYLNGFSSALTELKDVCLSSSDLDAKSYSYGLLGAVLQKSNLYEDSIVAYNKSLEYLENDTRSRGNYIGIADCILKSGKKEDAISYISAKVEALKLDNNKAQLYKHVGNIYKEDKQYFEASLAYVNALTFLPSSTELLFSLAYNVALADYEAVASYFYSQLISFENDDSSANNNLGVTYDRLGMKFRANKFFRKAWENGKLSLAASNLANIYINSGLEEEAKKVLDVASKLQEVDPNVWSSLEKLNKDLKTEEENYEKLLRERDLQQSFFRKYAFLFFEPKKEVQIDLSGKWLLMKDKEIEAVVRDGSVEFQFFGDGKEKKDVLKLNFTTLIGTALWSVVNARYESFPKEFNGHVIYDKQSNTILVLVKNGYETRLCELSRPQQYLLNEK